MSVFVIADTHLSFSSSKPMDIFGGWQNYVERLEENWRRLVSPCDTVIIPGDISWGMRLEDALPDFKFLNSLPGKKILLKGNHDYWWTTYKKMCDFFAANGLDTMSLLFNNAFEADGKIICGTRGWLFEDGEPFDKKIIEREAGRLRLSLQAACKLNGEMVVCLHYPPIYGDDICPEILDVLVEFNIKRVYYGHLHSFSHKKAFQGNWNGIEMRLISADYLDFCPKLVV
jgi:predicted phosphohydrolase